MRILKNQIGLGIQFLRLTAAADFKIPLKGLN